MKLTDGVIADEITVPDDIYTDEDLLKRINNIMKNEIAIPYKTYIGDGTGKNYVMKNSDNKVVEVSYMGNVLSVDGENLIKDAEGNTYISGYAALQLENEKLTRKVKKLKRKIEKLEVKLMHQEDRLL